MDRLSGYESMLSRIEHKKAQVKSQLPSEHAYLVDEFAVYVLEQVNTCLDVPANAAQNGDDHLGSNGTVTRAPTSDIQIDNEQTNHTNAPSTTVDNHNREATSGSISGEQTVQPLPPVTHSTTIQANIKIKVEDLSPIQSVQHFKCVKKEEEDGGEYVMECDCEDCETCRVKREMKEELEESGFETELGGKSGETGQGFTKVKKEEDEDEAEVERPNKIQRMDRVVGNWPVESPSPNAIPINVEYVNDQMSTSSTNPITIQDHTQPSQPVPLPSSISTSSSSSAHHVNEPLQDELLTGEPRMDNVVEVDASEFDREPIEGANSTLNPDDEEETEVEDSQNGEEEGDQTIEQREDTSVADEQQVPAENFVKRIEPADELGNRFECDYRGCGKRTKRKNDLIKHIRTHTGEKRYKCSVASCDRAFFQKCHLDEHFRTHTGQRPFVCETCNATFAHHSNLVIHLRTHTGARPFACTWPDCGQAFIRSDNLKTHSLVHSNERQFVCDVTGCTKVYKHKVTLRRHQKAQHN